MSTSDVMMALAMCDGGNDIPKVFFTGTAPTTKAQGELPLLMEYRSKSDEFRSYVTLKVQGDTSASYPKKNFNVKMFKDADRTEKDIRSFKGWNASHKYCLKANWIDHTHARNVVGGRLWGQIVRSRDDYANYPEAYRRSTNCGAVDGFPVKVYLNGVYQGLYTWNIRKDESMFNMDEDTGVHSALIADAPNMVTVWRELPKIDGSDWTDEINDVVPKAVKNGFENAYKFVMESTDEEFAENIERYFYLSSLIDYYIYIYCNLMIGGLSKSQTMLTYDGLKFMANIYDMDTTWGLHWAGTSFYDVDTPCPSGYTAQSEVGASNLLYERIAKLFPDTIKTRYAELRETVLSDANIITEFERFMDVIPNDLYAEDFAATTAGGAFTDIPSHDTNNLQKLREIIAERMTYCDEQLLHDVEDTSIEWQSGGIDAYGNNGDADSRLRTIEYIPDNIVRVSVPEEYRIIAVAYDDSGSVKLDAPYVSNGSFSYTVSGDNAWKTTIDLVSTRCAKFRNIRLLLKRNDNTPISYEDAHNVVYEVGDVSEVRWSVGVDNYGYYADNNARAITFNLFEEIIATANDGYELTATVYNENSDFLGYWTNNAYGGSPAWGKRITFTSDTISDAKYVRLIIRRTDGTNISVDEASNVIITDYKVDNG